MEFPHAPNFQNHHVEYLRSLIEKKEKQLSDSSVQIFTIDIALLPDYFGPTSQEKVEKCIEYLNKGLYIIDSSNVSRTI